MKPLSATDPAAMRRVLVVDDEPSIRDPLGRFLLARGYEVYSAEGASTALPLLERHQFGVILCDVRMPGRSGLDLLPEIRRRDPDCAVIMLTGLNDAATATEALSLGAVDYLTKPVELERLADSIGQALDRRRTQIDQRDVERLVREEVALRTAGLEREKLALRAHTVEVLATLVTLTEAKTPSRSGHARRMATVAARIAAAMELDADTVDLIETAGRICDIGKVAVPDAILARTGRLTPAETDAVREHVRIGVDLLMRLRHLAPLLPFIRDRHEWWDGSGYPAGLQGEAISIGGRILAVADEYVALTSGRPLTPAAALDHFETHAGSRFDPAVVAALRAVVAASEP